MIIYEVKISIDQDVEQEWLEWMKKEHAPDVVATGYAKSFQVLKPIEEASRTYFFQYIFDSLQDFETYKKEEALRLKLDVIERYPNKFEASRRLFEVL